ncbi:hypothetical protein MANES_01G163850v8 [Manihot esculenta]|uniref:Uncharacterized protein n=1 Tax=Manihot esculenta TaxID=3983 RepID=A0ACB7IGI0_MANES|nr:hypothetical protein MANES_01G163850v8 [Manihot esculenta]
MVTTSGLGLPADECLLHERRAFATLLSRLLRKFKGESCDLFGSLNPQHPERPLFPAAFLLTEFCVWEMALLIMLGLLFFRLRVEYGEDEAELQICSCEILAYIKKRTPEQYQKLKRHWFRGKKDARKVSG